MPSDPIGSDDVVLRGGVDGPRQHVRWRSVRSARQARVGGGLRPSGLQPPFLEVAPLELGGEPFRAPPGRLLLRVLQQGDFDELLLGYQHGVRIGIGPCKTSVTGAIPKASQLIDETLNVIRETAGGPAELRHPPFEQTPLGAVVGQRQCTIEGGVGLLRPAETTEELASRGVEVAIVLQVEAIDDVEPRLWPLRL